MNPSQNQSESPDPPVAERAQLEKMRQQILTDLEALRAQESNLRQYEQRLREAAPAVVTGSSNSRPPMSSDSIEQEWEKIRRSRTLLDAERRAFLDERLELRENLADVRLREEGLRQREAWLAVQEKEFAARAAAPAAIPLPPAAKPSFVSAPFTAAKNLLSLRSAS